MKKLNVVIIHNTNTHLGLEIKTIHDDLKEFYSIIQCTCIDIVVRRINGIEYNIILDDEGLLKCEHHLTMIEEQKREGLVGTLIICGINKANEEELGTLTKEESIKLFKYLISHREYTF